MGCTTLIRNGANNIYSFVHSCVFPAYLDLCAPRLTLRLVYYLSIISPAIGILFEKLHDTGKKSNRVCADPLPTPPSFVHFATSAKGISDVNGGSYGEDLRETLSVHRTEKNYAAAIKINLAKEYRAFCVYPKTEIKGIAKLVEHWFVENGRVSIVAETCFLDGVFRRSLSLR